jgi:inward rectifier potassium channel
MTQTGAPIDGTFAQTIHARHLYTADDIVQNARFVDMAKELPGGRRVVDIRVIDDYIPLETSA